MKQVRQNYAANLKMKMWCLKSSWINWGRAGDPLRGSSYFPAPPPCSWYFHKLPVWLRCPVIRTSWFLGLQTPLTGSCTQVRLCVPGSHSGTHRQDSPTQTACKDAAVLYRQPKGMSVSRMLTGLAAKQCQVKCRLGPFNCVNPLSGHRCYKNEKSKEK